MAEENNKKPRKRKPKEDTSKKAKAPKWEKFDSSEDTTVTVNGVEYKLPRQLEEYRKVDPEAAAEYEKNRRKQVRQALDDCGIPRQIKIPTDYDPRLDPNSEEFDAELYKEYSEATHEALENLKQAYSDVIAPTMKEFTAIALEITRVIEPVMIAVKSVSEAIYNSEVIKTYSEIINTIAEKSEAIKLLMEEQAALNPYLEEALRHSKFGELTLDEYAALPDSEEKDEEWTRIYQEAVAAKEAAEQAKNLPVIPTVDKPKSHKILNSKVANKYLNLQDMFLSIKPDGQFTMLIPDGYTGDPQEFMQPVITRNKKEKKDGSGKITVVPEIRTNVALAYFGDMPSKLARVKPFDRIIYNSVISLYAAGNIIIRTEDIWRHYTRYTSDRKPTAKQLERIDTALKKFSGTRISLDVTEELKNHTIDGEKMKEAYYDEPLLSYTGFTGITESGKTVKAISLTKEPILYTYSLAKKQIISIPVEWLELPKGLSATEEVVGLRDYLLAEINQIKGNYRNNNIINYANLLSQIEKTMQDLSRRDKGRYTEIVYKLLNSFRDRGIIIDYKVRNGKKNEVLGFEIKV